MRRELLAWAGRRGGVFTRADALARFAAHVVDDAVQAGVLIRVLPSTYALADDRGTLRRAALVHRPDAALAALDALDVWAILSDPPAHGPIRMVTDATHRESTVPQLRVSRRAAFRNAPPDVVVRAGMRVTRLEQTIVDSWPYLPPIDRRAPALVAVRERRTTGARLLDALSARGRVTGAAEMRETFGLVAAGCHSPLEVWGHQKVFSQGELRRAQCQARVQIGGKVVFLDRYYADEMLAVELDGAAYHGAPHQRERDIRRDAALATLGIQTIRFSHPRLFGDREGVRAETLDVLAMRRRQFRRRPA
jgi:very-short-patch-repair endonuclease